MGKLSRAKKTRTKTKYRVCGAKSKNFRRRLEELCLAGTKAKFCGEQLRNLNFAFRTKVEEHLEGVAADDNLILAKSVAERFVQRLVCVAGLLDGRFSSKYLVALNDKYDTTSKKLTYLLRIDALSTPVLYENDPEPEYEIYEDDDMHPGYAKLKIHGNLVKEWEEFTNCTGYLRRDKLQSKIVELLARAASRTEPLSSLDVDESTFCGSPGKIVDAATLHKILHTPNEKHVYYAAGTSSTNFPHPKDFRIAIVDEPQGIRIHLEFLSRSLSHISLEIFLLIGIGVDYWSASTNFPFRVSLGHTDSMLYYTASKTGMYLVGYGVHSSGWQIRFPAAENIILNHYSNESTVRTVLKVILLISDELTEIYGSHKHVCPILNEHVLYTALLYELENDKSHPTTTIINWSPLYLSCLVLRILDRIAIALQKEFYPNYFFPKANLIPNPGHLSEEDYLVESHKIKHYITKLFDDSLLPNLPNSDHYNKMISAIRTESFLLEKWKEIINNMVPPKSTRARRLSFNLISNRSSSIFTQYTHRQIEYIGMLLKNVFSVKENVWKNDQKDYMKIRNYSDDPTEEVIYLLVTILEQAKDSYVSKSTDSKSKEKLRLNFYLSTNKLVQLVRKDAEINLETTQDDVKMVKIILKWLYKSMDQSKKYFAPILRPYLNLLFTTSHAVSWHTEHMKRSSENREFESLGIFGSLVNKGKISPATGLVDAYNKRWSWAEDMLELLEKGKLRLIFIPERQKVIRHTLAATTCQKNNLSIVKKLYGVNRSVSFSTRCYFDGLIHKGSSTSKNSPIHEILKQKSPMNNVIKFMYRNGDHRCAGDIFSTLFSMHKIYILQEIAGVLPEEDRSALLKRIHQLLAENDKRKPDQIWSRTLPNPQRGVLPLEDVPKEKYTVLDESAGIKATAEEKNNRKGDKDTELDLEEIFKKLESKDSLLGSCRAARFKDNKTMMFDRERVPKYTLHKF